MAISRRTKSQLSYLDSYRAAETRGYSAAKRQSEISSKIDLLTKEIAYLEKVEAGSIQLYLYDRDASRIIELIGTPSETTTRVITYVPGTFTSLFNFYDGGVQQVSGYLTEPDSGAVAFVYKDGVFPGENQDTGEMNPLRIREANDQAFGRAAGVTLAGFEEGMRTDPLLGGREQVGIGHSWGLAALTSSEVAHTHYDKVISLSGAGMLPDWDEDPATNYADFSYRDILQTAQDLDQVWDGKNPRDDPAFEHGAYYRGPNDDILDNPPTTAYSVHGPVTTFDLRAPGVLLENHNLIAKVVPANRSVLEAVLEMVEP